MIDKWHYYQEPVLLNVALSRDIIHLDIYDVPVVLRHDSRNKGMKHS